ncbi:MAG: hypothetical protein KKF30_14525 [Proteobacteria bacterium]|nr:hypothetical protein [Pseudomonadota bacterium]MBU4472505.1 hypothetical protein [Pseudomonadota bacterium]MCG2751331.1 hypothetical protein [Desulfobacteraceae bacterium]
MKNNRSIRKLTDHFSGMMQWSLWIGLFAFLSCSGLAYAIDLSDSPMETLVQSAPPNIMFVLDDSGSMDWEFMTRDTEGKFEGNTEYLFDNPGDNTYSSSDSNGTILTGSNRKKWKSQWSGHNRLFYNPFVNYHPWPGKANASTTTPRSNPHYATWTMNLNDTYMALNDVSGSVIFVDNLTNTGNPYAAGGNFYYTGTWQESSHSPEWEGSSLYCDSTSGTSEAFWTPRLNLSGDYNVWVFWARNAGSNRDTSAKYTVSHASGTTDYTINQMDSDAGTWHYLGRHYFNAQNAVWPVRELIVDNSDGSPKFTSSGQWTNDTSDGSYGTNALRTKKLNAKATWTPVIPQAGNYTVYAWWNDVSSRDQNAKYTINYSGGQTDKYIDQSLTYGEWVELGTYAFIGGDSGSVTVTRHSSSTGTNTMADAIKFVSSGGVNPQHVKLKRGSTNSDYATSADAVAFVPPGYSFSSVNIKNSHYFVLDDVNNNGVRDTTEDVYLVNLDSSGRTYYRVTLTNDVINDQLTPVSDPPASIRPAVRNEQGQFVRYVTAEEDLQNFANWYSFYRRRELSAKAGVSNVINEMAGVRVGLYTINSSTGRQTVLPIKLDIGASLIVDDKDSTFTTNGIWSNSTAVGSYNSREVYTTTVGRKATWTPNIKVAGAHKVYAWWRCNANWDTKAKYTVVHSTGTHIFEKNQKQQTGNPCGQWVELGTYNFNIGSSGSVSVERQSTSTGSTVADAIYFEDLSGSSVNADETTALLNTLYSVNSANSTPLRTAFENVGKYFHADDGLTGNLGTSPFDSETKGGGCQQSFTILMTDGFYNDTFTSVGNVDSGMASPYGDTYSNTLADIAMKYYDTDLSSSLPNMVPTSSCDRNERQHLVTYSVSFGVFGSLTPLDSDHDGREDDPCFLNDVTTKPIWPNPANDDSYKIDDLWHAAVNGRGRFFSASDPVELAQSLKSLFEDIASRIASGASVSVNGEELGSDTTLYQALFNSDTWTGDILAYPMDPNSGEILRTESDIKWKASGKTGDPNGLQVLNWNTDRKIITFNTAFNVNGSAVPFRYAYLSNAQKTALDSGWTLNPANANNLVEYLRGREILGFRPRTRKLGDIVHSAPFLKGSAVYSGANDGMLHAFDKTTGREIFAYIPSFVFGNLVNLADLNYTHRFYVDNTPNSQMRGKISTDTKDILVCGLGKGGKGYFALDITNVANFVPDTTETEIANKIGLWEFPGVSTAAADVNDMGYSFSAAHIVKSYLKVDGQNRWVVIFGNGYNSFNGKAVLFIVDALNGTLIKKIDTDVGGDNGLSTPVVVDKDNDFIADYVYAGDLKGNLWKFDLTGATTAAWSVAFKVGSTPKPLFQALGQPITARPDVMWHPKDHGFLVVFGTGKYLHNTDRNDLSQQSVYGIWDYGDDEDDLEYLGSLDHSTGALTYPSGISLVKQEVYHTTSLNGEYYRTLTNNEIQWHEVVNGIEQDLPADTDLGQQKPNPVVHAGWYFDFPNADEYEGERVIKDVNIRDNKLFVLSFIPNISPCSGGGNSFFYIMDPTNGGRIDTPTIDINGDGKVDDDDLIQIGTDEEGNPIYASPTGKLNIGMLHAPKFIKIRDNLDKVIMSDSSGDIPVVDIVGESLGMYYWIER